MTKRGLRDFSRMVVLVGAAAGMVQAGTSVMVTSGSASFTIRGPYNAGAQPMRWEYRIHNIPSGSGLPNVPYGIIFTGDAGIGASNNPGQLSWGPSGLGTAYGDVVVSPVMSNSAAWSDILVRMQRDTGGVNCPSAANGCYTVEICDTTGGNCQSNISNITTLVKSWPSGALFFLKPGVAFAFLRWYSTVIPMGSTVPIAGRTGDLGDWEFEGNMNDSSGNGHNFTGGSLAFVPTPLYPPSCNPGTQQSFRAGHHGQLDGSGSMPLDDGSTLTYDWQQVAGVSPTPVRWVVNSHASAKPVIDGMTFGSYNFQLTVTDGSGQSSSCMVHDGAVATDNAGVVIFDNPAVTNLLGQAIQWGRNPWPWMDDRNKYVADIQTANIDQNYPDFWDAPASGTISVANNSNLLVGVETHFTTDVCQGPNNPTAPRNVMIIAWWNGGANRRGLFAQSCQDDTHITMDPRFYKWNLPSESGLTYSLDVKYWLNWQIGSNAQYPR